MPHSSGGKRSHGEASAGLVPGDTEGESAPLSQPPAAAGGSRHSLAGGRLTPLCASVFTWPPPPCAPHLVPLVCSEQDSSWDSRSILIQGCLEILTLILSAKSPFPDKTISTGKGAQHLDIFFGGRRGDTVPPTAVRVFTNRLFLLFSSPLVMDGESEVSSQDQMYRKPFL